MADWDVAQRARAYARELRERALGGAAPHGEAKAEAGESGVPSFLTKRAPPARQAPRSGELWMAFPKGAGLPTPVALLHAQPLLVVPMTREVWLADADDPLLPPEQSPTGEWLAALLPGAATMEAALLRRPVGGLPETLVTLLRRLVEGPALQRKPLGPVPVAATDEEEEVALPSTVTAWSSDAPELASWLGGQPIVAGDARAEARQLHLEAVAWVRGETTAAPTVTTRPPMLDRLRALLNQLGTAVDTAVDAAVETAASAALSTSCDTNARHLPWLAYGLFRPLGAALVLRASAATARQAPLEGSFELGSVSIELSFEPEPTQLRLTLIATRSGHGAEGVRLTVQQRRAPSPDQPDRPWQPDEPLVRVTGSDGLITGVILPCVEECVHELAIEADGHRRVLDL